MTLTSSDQPTLRLKVAAPIGSYGSSTDCYSTSVYMIYDVTDYIKQISYEEWDYLYSYITCPSSGGSGLAAPSGNTGGGGTPGNSNPSPIIIPYLDQNPCAKRIYDSLMAHSTMSNATSMFLGVKPILNWYICQLQKDDGITIATRNTNTVDITLNSSMLDRASGVYIATTMIHESLHAFMWAEVLARTGTDFKLDDPKLFDEYVKWGDTSNGGFQHNMMADNYRNTIIKGINEYDRSFNRPQRSDEELQALSWSGLKDTMAWKEFAYSLSNFQNSVLADRYLQILSDLSYGKENNDINKCSGSIGVE
jgi:hypothetical protein